MYPAYIAGLTGRGDRKSIQPMATRFDAIPYDRLHHFIGAGLWASAPLEATLWSQADQLVGGDRAWLIIDDTALPRKGKASVGVAPQYATEPSTFRARKLGWWVRPVRMANANTISQICPQTRQ